MLEIRKWSLCSQKCRLRTCAACRRTRRGVQAGRGTQWCGEGGPAVLHRHRGRARLVQVGSKLLPAAGDRHEWVKADWADLKRSNDTYYSVHFLFSSSGAQGPLGMECLDTLYGIARILHIPRICIGFVLC